MHETKTVADISEWQQFDAGIADEVMGLEWKQWRPYWSGEGWYPKGFNDKTTGNNYPDGYESSLPLYSSTVCMDWWKVIERMESLGFAWKLTSDKDEYSITFEKDSKWTERTGNEIPRMVCECALEAVRTSDQKAGE